MIDPKEIFIKDAVKRDRLAALLADPIMVEALDAVRYAMDAMPGGAAEANPVIAAARYQQIAGINFVTRELHSMTRDPVTAPKAPRLKRLIDKLPDDPTES